MTATTGMMSEPARVAWHGVFEGEYRRIIFNAPGIAAAAKPGQFVHMRIAHLEPTELRRPFSIYTVDDGQVSVMYKCVGHGTDVMSRSQEGDLFDLIGPLGRGYPLDHTDAHPVLVAGGYGVAPLSLFARTVPMKGSIFLGGRTAGDILCVTDFEEAGWDVHIATEDGSRGVHGRITDAFDPWQAAREAAGAAAPEIYACGPSGMLRALGERAEASGWQAWLSLDKPMGCGVGACLACVVRVKGPDGSTHWARSCREGPVFECREIDWAAYETGVADA